MWLLTLISVALASPSGFYHPADLTAKSARFAEANRSAGTAYEAASRRAVELARALNDYREALDLLGDAAPAEERERLERLEQDFHRQHARARAFADVLVEDFDVVFTDALERAVEGLGVEVTACEREIPDGPQVPGMRPRTKQNPACQGKDLNAEIAARMDADPTLQAELADILSIPWPTLDLPAEPQPVLGGGERSLQVRALLQQGAPRALADISRQDDQARMPFEAAIEAGAGKQELAAMVQAAREVTEQTAARRAALAAPVLLAAKGALDRWAKKGEPTTGWCANPPALGGCQPPDATEALVPRLLAHKKVARALR